MSWGPSKVLTRSIVAAVFLSASAAALADILVVRSVGPSARAFPAGKRLPETASISLKPGDRLIVLDGRGTRIIRGPGTFTAGVPVAGRIASSGPASQRHARIGAVSGIDGGELRPPSIWHVDVAKSSNVCVADSSKVTLWRPDPDKAVTLGIGGSAGHSKQLGWQAGSSTLAWPSDLPMTDGALYRLSRSGGAAPAGIRFRVMPVTPGGLEDMAQMLIRNRCDAQFDHLIETVTLPE